jgi:hypothetical protein
MTLVFSASIAKRAAKEVGISKEEITIRWTWRSYRPEGFLCFLKLLQSSISKRGGEIMSNKTNKLFPPGSRLGAIINLVIKGLDVLRNDGIAFLLRPHLKTPPCGRG